MVIVRLFAASSLLISLLFAAVLGAVTMQPLSASAACASPCWRAFQPGVTTFNEAVTLFDDMGWKPVGNYCNAPVGMCNTFTWVAPDQPDHRAGSVFTRGRLDAIAFQKPAIVLGDLMLIYGEPDSVSEYRSFDSTGAHYTIYRVSWRTTDLQIRLDCPTTFAAALFTSASLITLASESAQPESLPSPNRLQNRPSALTENFRLVCR
jgi:hypothetical protein